MLIKSACLLASLYNEAGDDAIHRLEFAMAMHSPNKNEINVDLVSEMCPVGRYTLHTQLISLFMCET